MFPDSPAASTDNPASATMSRTEVEQLLASVGGGDVLGSGPTPGSGAAVEGSVHRHDFPHLTTCSDEEMRKLRLRCDSYLSALAARLSAHLRLECAVQMIKVESVRFHTFAESLATPTFLTLFRLDPLASICLLDMPAKLALAIVDREQGGSAAPTEEVRDLTQIETKLAAKLADIALSEWCQVWNDVLATRPLIVRHENTARYLHICPPNTMLLVIAMEVHLGQLVETIQLAIPPSVQKPLVAKLNADLPGEEKVPPADIPHALHWNAALNDLDIQITARWSGLQISARQLASLKPGDVVPLRAATPDRVQLFLGSQAKFSGQLGTAGQQWAIRIIEPLKP